MMKTLGRATLWVLGVLVGVVVLASALNSDFGCSFGPSTSTTSTLATGESSTSLTLTETTDDLSFTDALSTVSAARDDLLGGFETAMLKVDQSTIPRPLSDDPGEAPMTTAERDEAREYLSRKHRELVSLERDARLLGAAFDDFRKDERTDSEVQALRLLSEQYGAFADALADWAATAAATEQMFSQTTPEAIQEYGSEMDASASAAWVHADAADEAREKLRDLPAEVRDAALAFALPSLPEG